MALTQDALLVEGPIPDECTTRECHREPAVAVELEPGRVSRRRGESPYPGDPPDGAVSPYVCERCREQHYPGVDEDAWRPIVAVATDGGTEVDDYHRTCWDCEWTAASPLPHREVHVDLPSGGYDTMSVPLCRDCIGERFGWDCPQCGLLHEDRESAKYCCRRHPGEAPDCPECGRRMERKAWGMTAMGEQTVEWAECECCPVGWGAFTGWDLLDGQEPCEHIDTDPRGDADVE